MLFDLNKIITTALGEDTKDEKGEPGYIWKMLAPMFANSVGQGAQSLKLWGWAKALIEEKALEIDDVDRKFIRSLIENHKELPVMYQAQILDALDTDNAVTKKAEDVSCAE